MHPIFHDPKKKFVITLFIQEEDFAQHKKDIETLGKQKNVKLVVQPCPFEAVEFLYRVDFNLKGQTNSFDKSYFWQSLTLKNDIADQEMQKISDAHYAYLVAIVQNDALGVEKYAGELQSLL
ncbi:MAG: hypothetical protein KDD46_08425 [Bdellovibrionales bacterium]|nr:hypothetical protein [Bdellovibrionales bacterium]